MYLTDIPDIYLSTFNKHPTWICFFETHNIPYFIESSSVASYLNSEMIYHLLQFTELEQLIQCLDDPLHAHLYLASLYLKEGYILPYQDIFSGTPSYQHYHGWRLFFSSYLKKYACDKTLIRFVMDTTEKVCAWQPYQVNIALTLLYAWLKHAQKHGYPIQLFYTGENFVSFLYHIGYTLFQTKDDGVVIRELCKYFHLTFEGLHSFDDLLDHFRIFDGQREFYCNEPIYLSERLTTFLHYEKKMIFV